MPDCVEKRSWDRNVLVHLSIWIATKFIKHRLFATPGRRFCDSSFMALSGTNMMKITRDMQAHRTDDLAIGLSQPAIGAYQRAHYQGTATNLRISKVVIVASWR